ncbi:MAG: CoA transferase [Thermodesulfobacteriota bacterium]|jgi:crotonobetainyl-CoA:carnitine CoA-transferase CaiB-like acyl-CoA transferase
MTRRPLDGIRIADLTWLLAGAGGPRLLASLGAEVIRIEWRDRLDFLRYMPPFAPLKNEHAEQAGAMELSGLSKEGVKSVNRAGYFNDINAGKRGISLNMGHPKGRELFKRLVAVSDVVVEAFTAETMRKWGLDYEALRAIKPDIIYVQQPGWGYKGPYVKFASYGPIAQAVSGLTEQSGLPAPYPPAGWGFSYMDWSGAYYCALTMLCAIYYKKRTGKGQYIDCSQVEPGIYMTGTAILDYLVNGRHSQRTGNRSPYVPAAPHGAYRCAGNDRWIALAVTTEEEWRALVREMGDPAWARQDRFATLAARVRHQDDLDHLVEEWTKDKEPFALQERLQRAGVPAGVCQTAQDRIDHDPQLKHLNWLIPLPHREIGTWPVKDVPFHFTHATVNQGGPTERAAPCYGEDNTYVYGELLQLTEQERAELEREGVI